MFQILPENVPIFLYEIDSLMIQYFRKN